MTKEQAIKNVNKIRAAVAPEYERLNVDLCGFWPSSKANEIANAGNNLVRLIQQIEEHSTKVKKVEPAQSEMSFLLNLDLSTLFPSHKAGDLDERQFNWGSISSVEKMMNFRLRYWVEERTRITLGRDGDDITEEIPAHWKQDMSMRQALQIARYNPIRIVFGAILGSVDHRPLWGKSLSLIKTEERLDVKDEQESKNII